MVACQPTALLVSMLLVHVYIAGFVGGGLGEAVLGKVRTRKVKTLAKTVNELYGARVSTSFEENKKLVREVLEGRFSKKLANRIAGYLVTLKKLELKKQQAAAAEEEATKAAELSSTES
ncbi:MAG: hypothetical protein QXN23_07635 [Candidatus Caldarchaeum sp.]